MTFDLPHVAITVAVAGFELVGAATITWERL